MISHFFSHEDLQGHITLSFFYYMLDDILIFGDDEFDIASLKQIL